MSVESSHAHNKVTKTTSDVITGEESTVPVIKVKKQVSLGACSSNSKLNAYTGDG